MNAATVEVPPIGDTLRIHALAAAHERADGEPFDGPAREPAAPSAHAASRQVLVCDDDKTTRNMLSLLLETEHYVVLQASTGREGIDIARLMHPDLLLIDLNMPDMDGYEAIARLRREPGLLTLPIAVLTSEEGPDVERRVRGLGANDYLVKPFDPEVLLARVQALMRAAPAAAG